MAEDTKPEIVPTLSNTAKENANKTVQLLQQEHLQSMQDKARQQARIGTMAVEVEAVLMKHNSTWREWGEVIMLMNARLNEVVDALTVNSIAQSYERQHTNGGGEKKESGR